MMECPRLIFYPTHKTTILVIVTITYSINQLKAQSYFDKIDTSNGIGCQLSNWPISWINSPQTWNWFYHHIYQCQSPSAGHLTCIPVSLNSCFGSDGHVAIQKMTDYFFNFLPYHDVSMDMWGGPSWIASIDLAVETPSFSMKFSISCSL